MALLVIFCLPFIGFGLFAVYAGLEKWIAGEPGEGAMLTLFGLLFVGVAFAVLALARRGSRLKQQIEARKARYADAPWLWNEAWADGRLRSSARAGVILAWVFALVWNGISLPLCFALPREIESGNHAAWIGALFPLVGVGLLVWAVRATLHWRKFGESRFEMPRVPGVLGGELSGTLHASLALAGSANFSARLACIRRYTTGSGKNRSTHERILWTEQERIPGTAAGRGPHGVALPVRFAIPFDTRPSDPLPSDDYILWRLEVSADVSGVDFHTHFDVPVFQTSDSDSQRIAEVVAREHPPPPASPVAAAPSRIRVHPHPEGGIEILFPAARHKGAASMTTLFGLVFSGITWGTHELSAPFLFTLCFGATSALIVYAALTLWAGSTKVLARADGVAVQQRLFGIGRTRRIPAERIERVALDVGMQSGRTAFWDLRLHTPGSKRGVRVGGRIRDKREAERLAQLLRNALRP